MQKNQRKQADVATGWQSDVALFVFRPRWIIEVAAIVRISSDKFVYLAKLILKLSEHASIVGRAILVGGARAVDKIVDLGENPFTGLEKLPPKHCV